MSKMHVAQVTRPNGPLEIVEREIPEPGAGSVRIKVEACGVCHSDSFTKEGIWPGIQYPRVPGHEIAGIIDAVGTGVVGWTPGQRVGVGWHGGNCGYCDSCRRGDFVTCQIAFQVPGIAYDGGYAEYMIAPAGALALIPEGLSAVDAGPLMCAGSPLTTRSATAARGPAIWSPCLVSAGSATWGFSSPRRWVLEPLPSREEWTRNRWPESLVRFYYIDSHAQDAAAELVKLGGAKVILATVTSGKAMSAVLGGLGVNGKLIIVGAADEPLEVNAFAFHRRAAFHHRLAFRQLHRFARYACLQRTHRRARYE